MPAYIVALRKGPVRDAEALEEYRRRNIQMRDKLGDLKMTPRVIYGATEALEGTAPDGVVLLEFPSMEDARAWYHNEDYQAAVPFRKKAADYEMFIVEGVDF